MVRWFIFSIAGMELAMRGKGAVCWTMSLTVLGSLVELQGTRERTLDLTGGYAEINGMGTEEGSLIIGIY